MCGGEKTNVNEKGQEKSRMRLPLATTSQRGSGLQVIVFFHLRLETKTPTLFTFKDQARLCGREALDSLCWNNDETRQPDYPL